ncbi:rhomboid family intramembrane serine protease [Clostridium sp. DL1XJH146]
MNNFNTAKYIINKLTEEYGYQLEELSANDYGENFWGVAKFEEDKKILLVFLGDNDYSKIDEDSYRIRVFGDFGKLQFIKVVFSDDDRWLNGVYEEESRERVIVISSRNERIYHYTRDEEIQAMQINNIMDMKNKEKNKNTRTLKAGAIATNTLIVINILMFIVTAFFSSSIFSIDANVLVVFGAKVNSLIEKGQYYRLITAAFLHGGILHLLVNMYALRALGPLVERVYGRNKFIAIYFVAGIVGNIFSYSFVHNSLSVGASGAIFGLLGATLIYAYKMRSKIGTGFVYNIISVIILNVVIGFTLPNIDTFGHLGGFVGGTLIALAIGFKNIIKK